MLANVYSFPHSLCSYFLQRKEDSSPFKDLHDLDALARVLTSKECRLDQWVAWKNDIKAFILEHSNNLEQLNAFLTSVTEWGIERNPQRTLAVLVDVVSLEILTCVVTAKQQNPPRPFTNIFDLAVENASHFPEPADTSLKARVHSEWRKCRPVILYFIPNLINIFLGAFNFLDSHKKLTTLWEKHLLLEIVYKFFIIPYCLIQILQPMFVVTAKVYLVAALVIVALGILVSCYQRWFRPIPDEIAGCTNLDKQMERGVIEPKVGQVNDMACLIAALEMHDSIVILGRSGEGKTALVHHFTQLKHEGKLPKKFQGLTIYEADCGLMVSSASFGHSEIINQIKDQIAGYEDKLLLFFDDFYQIANNKAAFLAFKKRFLQDQPRCKSILALTFKEWEEIQQIDLDCSFRRKIFRMEISPSTDVQIRQVLKNFQFHFAQDVPITEEAIQAVVEISTRKDYLPDIGSVAKAEEIFKTAIGRCRATYHHYYGDLELDQEQLDKTHQLVQKVKKIIAHQQKMNREYHRLSYLFSKCVVKEHVERPESIEIHQDQLDKIDIWSEDNTEMKISISILPSIPKESISEKDQILYLWYCFYAREAMKKLLHREMSQLDPQISIQVNKDLINRCLPRIRAQREETS
jgi:hypothetical protein